jgi:GH15 family glucan-1,4-alpha-glucosidase
VSELTAIEPEELARTSVRLLLDQQSSSGSFVACPTFPVYEYAWFRDGAFCAYALDAAGEQTAARRFHEWAARTVVGQRPRIESALRTLRNGGDPAPGEMLPARYTLDGRIEPTSGEPWPNFQLDGYGTWLWALEQHLQGEALPDELAPAVALIAEYLTAAWRVPCWSWWEERDGGEHASTHAAVAAGLAAAASVLGEPAHARAAADVRADLERRFVRNGHFVRGSDDARLDGSLLALGVPFDVSEPASSTMRATVDAVRSELVGPSGGVRRYIGDTYYGGGEWVLLTCWLATYDAREGRDAELQAAQSWICAQADEHGLLPEQSTDAPQSPDMVEHWIRRWGSPASPLLWSHAMFLVLQAEIGGRDGAAAQQDELPA